MNKYDVIILKIVCCVAGSVVVAVIGLAWCEFHSSRRHAESAVARTVESSRRMGAPDTLSLDAITKAAVGRASVQILATNPVVFRVSVMTPWPDWMIYEHDSTKPDRGVHHYLF